MGQPQPPPTPYNLRICGSREKWETACVNRELSTNKLQDKMRGCEQSVDSFYYCKLCNAKKKPHKYGFVK